MIATPANTNATPMEIHAPIGIGTPKEKGKNIDFYKAKRTLQENKAAELEKNFQTSPKNEPKTLKNQMEMDKVVDMWNKADSNIKDVEVDKKFRYVEFKYQEKYQVKYKPTPAKKDNPGKDEISITDILTNKSQTIQIDKSLFYDNMILKDRKNGTTKIKERMEFCIKMLEIVKKYIAQDSTLTPYEEEKIYIKPNGKVYFAAEKLIAGEKEPEEVHFVIENYQKAQTEGNKIIIPEKYTIRETRVTDDSDEREDNAY